MKRCVVIVVKRDDAYLMGMRNDSGKNTFPAGHLEDREDPKTGAARELLEETGYKAESLKPLGFYWNTPDVLVYVYAASVSGKADFTKDPDREFSSLFFKRLDEVSDDEWHIPKKWNCALRCLKA